MSKPRPIALLLLAGALLFTHPALGASVRTWLWLAGAEASPADYGRFDLVALDASRHPPLERAAPGRPLLLGTLSVGEVASSSPLWEQADGLEDVAARRQGFLVMDLRSPGWRSVLLDQAVPGILAQGFDGVFLDTIDACLALDGDPAQQAARRTGILDFLRVLRARHPGMHIAMNRGLGLMPEAAKLIDTLLMEELTCASVEGKPPCQDVPAQVRQVLVAKARAALAVNPQLTVLTLDYAAPDQWEQIGKALGYARSKGFAPYVGPPALDQIFFHSLAP